MQSINESLKRNQKFDPKSITSYEKFIQRLKTYELFKWFAKPAEFSPLECAKHGWTNLSKDTLKCVSCSSIFYYYTKTPVCSLKFTFKQDENFQNADVLIKKHNQNCPWRTLVVPDSIINIDLYDEEKILKDYESSKLNLQKCPKLPVLAENIFEKFDESFMDKSPGRQQINEKLTPDKVILILSSTGWSYNENKKVLNCNKCFRSIALWLYQTFDFTEEDEESVEQQIDSNKANDSLEIKSAEMCEENKNNELIAREVLSSIINAIEIDEQTSLKHRNDQKDYLRKVSNILITEINPKKRKLDQMSESAYERKIEENTRKLFEPINEHYNWCRWTQSEPTSLAEGRKETVSQVYYKKLRKALQKSNKLNKSDSLNEESKSKNRLINESFINSETLLEKVRAAQSLLINCTSKLTFKK